LVFWQTVTCASENAIKKQRYEALFSPFVHAICTGKRFMGLCDDFRRVGLCGMRFEFLTKIEHGAVSVCARLAFPPPFRLSSNFENAQIARKEVN